MKRKLLLSLAATTYLMANTVTLEPITVTATKTETTMTDAPGSVSVISKETIQTLPAPGPKEVVKGLDGVTAIQHRGIADVNPIVVVRGIPDQSRTMILLDGVPMNTSYSSSAATPYTMDNMELERVEVIRGPFSSLYGSSAMGGVINYITKMPDSPEYTASVGYGDASHEGEAPENLKKIYVSAADKITDELKFKVSYSALSSEGYPSDFVVVTAHPPAAISGYMTESSPTGGTQYIVGNKGDRGVSKQNVSAKLVYTPTSNDTLGASYRRSHYYVDYSNPESYLRDVSDNTIYSYNPPRLRESSFLVGDSELTSDLYVLNYTHTFSGSTLDVRYSFLSIEDWYISAGTLATQTGETGTLTPREAKNTMLHVTWQQPLGDSLLLLGAEYKKNQSDAHTTNLTDWRDEGSTTTRASASGGKERTIAGFAELQSEITERLSSNIGGRFESWKGYNGYNVDDVNSLLNETYATRQKNNFSPKISLNYQATDATMLKASWGQAFRAPDPVELYRTYTVPGVNWTFVGNPDLKPEQSESYDFGFEQKTAQNGLFKAYWFHTIIDDMIATKTIDPTAMNVVYERGNIGKARSRGYELSYAQPMPNDLTLNTNYTKTYTKILENDLEPSLVGKEFAGIPEDMVNISLTYDNQKFYGLINYNYQSKIYNNANNSDTVSGVYGSIDATGIYSTKIGYRMNKNFDLSLLVTNLTDKDYYSYEKAEGRSWFVQANFKL